MLKEAEVEEMSLLNQILNIFQWNLLEISVSFKLTFFWILPIFSVVDVEAKKAYFTSKDLDLSTESAVKACQLNDMILASPQSQDEYDSLKNSWKNMVETKNYKHDVGIAGYLSNFQNLWFDSGDKLNYKISWAYGEPNNGKRNEYCMFLRYKNEVAASDGSCSGNDKPFICEVNQESLRSVTGSKTELERFFQKISNEMSQQKNVEMFVNREFLQAQLIDAKLLCKMFGLEFYSKDVDEDNLGDSSVLSKFVCYKLKTW